ncbi:MAG: YtxH domain-containing protein [Telmatospirillum sp.]|nr:YtxH domain-containing protein [Telmatospirillum sp.]
MAKKKHKKNRRKANEAALTAAPAQNGGLLGGLTRLLPARGTAQFLLGAAIGAVAAYVLADENIRGRLLRSGMSLYAELAGGLAEFREQVADIKAEMDAGQSGVA